MKNLYKLTTLLIALTLSTSLMAIDYVVSGAGSTEVNGTYLEDIVVNGKTSYKYADATTYYLFYYNSYWHINDEASASAPNEAIYYVLSSANEPPSSGWTTGNAGDDPSPTIAESQTYSLEFDGLNDYVDLGTSSDLKPTAALTVEVWANADNWQSVTTGKLVSNTHVGGYDLSIRNAGITFTVYSDGNYRQPQFSNSGYSGWHHIAGTFDGQYAKLYIDGILKNTVDMGTSGNAITYGYPNNSTLLGAEASSGSAPDGNYFDGKIDEVRIWGDVRSIEELQEYICEDVSGQSNLVAYYRMSNGSGTSLADISSNSNTGTLYDGGSIGNGPTWQTDYLIPSGDGTSGTEYQIQTLNHLWWLSQNSGEWGKLFEQTADINMTLTQNWDGGDGFTSIGNITIKFTGSYDGQGHTITGIYINRSASPIGFFGQVNNGTITNLNLESASVTGNWYAGGLVGDNNGLIDNCSYTGDVAAPYYCGGIAARNSTDDIIINSYANANVTVTGSSPAASGGGFTGGNTGAIINCYSHGNVLRNHPSSISGNFGAFCGRARPGSSTMYCYSTGDVTYTGATDPTDKGFIGSNLGTAYNNFFDSEASNQTTATGADPKTTVQMKTQSTFTDAGWDFTSPVWAIAGGTNNGYPNLESNTSTKTWLGGTTDYLTAWTALSNWDDGILPTATDNISIPGNLTYNPTISGSTLAVCNKLVIVSSTGIGTNASLTIDDDGGLTVSNNLDNDGTLTINSTADGTGSLIINGTLSNSGTITSQRYFPGSTLFNWHMVSSPMDGMDISESNFIVDPATNYDFYAWHEPTPGTWVNYKVTSGDLFFSQSTVNNGDNFASGKGYLVAYNEANPTKTFTGNLNTGDKTFTLKCSGGKSWTWYAGWNLLGNPYSSAIDWNDAPSRTDKFEDNYAYIYDPIKSGGEGYVTVDGGSADAYIAANQGFFVRAKLAANNTSFTFNNAMQTHGGSYMKNQTNVERLVLRFSDGEHYDETEIKLNNLSSHNNDRNDAIKLYSFSSEIPQLLSYSLDEVPLAVNSIPEVTPEKNIKIGLRVPKDGLYTLSVIEASIYMMDHHVYLEDLLLNTLHKVSDSDYSFISDAGDIADRFIIHFGMVGIEDQPQTQSNIQTWAANNTIHILNPENQIGEIRVLNLFGQQVAQTKLSGDTKQEIQLNVPTGCYLVCVVSEEGVVTRKVVLRH